MVAGPYVIRRVRSLPDGCDGLLESSVAEGYDLVDRLVRDWNDGTNRFEGEGEALFAALSKSWLGGIGGLNRDPYVDDPGVGRIRHLYVSPEARGRGLGRALVVALVDHARGRFERVRLRATPLGASEFYLRLGFEETQHEQDSTHQIRLS